MLGHGSGRLERVAATNVGGATLRATNRSPARTTEVLHVLDLPLSNWHRRPKAERKRPGPPAKPIPDEIVAVVVKMATASHC